MRHWFNTIWNTRGLARWILLAGLVIVVVFVVLAVFAPWVAPYDFNQSKVDGDEAAEAGAPRRASTGSAPTTSSTTSGPG